MPMNYDMSAKSRLTTSVPSVCMARRGTRAVFALPAAGQTLDYARLGFVPTNRSLDFMGYELAGSLNRDPAAWRFTLGDTDFF